MPFKGDMRLGGPHDNEARLNGTSDGPSVPVAGTLLRTENNVPWASTNGGPVITYDPSGESPTYFTASKVTVDVRADGIGGEYYDWANVRNMQYYADGTVILTNVQSGIYQVNVVGLDFESGTYVSDLVHDGNGNYRYQTSSTYYNGYFYTASAQPHHETYYGQEYLVGTHDVEYYHNGSGGYTTQIVNIQPYQDYTVVGGRSESIYMEVPSGSGNSFQSGSTSYEVYVYQGFPTDSGAGNTSYTSSGTYITEYNGDNYYWDGNGYYYVSNTPAYGTPTGNSGGGTNYININGNDYENGSYSYTEYNDGNGGTYSDYSYSYQYYGYQFFSEGVDDGMGNYYTVYYYSDGNGSYYTGT